MQPFPYQEIFFETIDSTNLYAKTHASELGDRTFVRALFQEKGKGRGEHTWVSKKGDGLLFSLLIKDKDLVKRGGYLSFVAAVAVLKELSSIASLASPLKKHDFAIKWPNDIYLNDKKVCGILLEGKAEEFVVIGIGINFNQESFEGEYRFPPTSLALETGTKIDMEMVKEKIYQRLLSDLDHIDVLHKDSLELFAQHDYLKNREVSFVKDGLSYNGKAVGVNDSFALLVDVGGDIHEVRSGEIKLITLK